MRQPFPHRNLHLIGILAWLSLAIFLFPNSLYQANWVLLILLLAPLFLVPLGAKIVLSAASFSPQKHLLFLLAALAFSSSYFLEKSLAAALLVTPYLVATIGLFIQVYLLPKNQENTVSFWCQRAAFAFLPIAPMWALVDRLDWQPLGFEPIIILMTVVHFHYAGFVLLLVTSFILRDAKSRLAQLFGWGVTLGVPAVAIGITTTQFDFPAFIEIIAVTLTGTSAFGIAILHLQKGLKIGLASTKGLLFSLGGLALAAGMILALCYGWRTVFPLSFLSIPWMYAVHGTLNSLGFALPILVAWGAYFHRK